ncbi:glycosyl transferase, partial [Sesbania bispinosa]
MADFSTDSEWESRGSATASLQIPGSAYSSLNAGSEATSSDGEELVAEVAVSRGKRTTSSSVSGKRKLRPEELRTCGEEELEGYFIKIDYENKGKTIMIMFLFRGSNPWCIVPNLSMPMKRPSVCLSISRTLWM